MAHSESVREAKDDSGLTCAAITLLRKLLEKVVTAGHTDPPESGRFEKGHSKSAHVALVQQFGRRQRSGFDARAFELVGRQRWEGAVSGPAGDLV